MDNQNLRAEQIAALGHATGLIDEAVDCIRRQCIQAAVLLNA
jgi:hypothetical protein